eukprot:COSAG02_NODE_69_length_42323_cov_23.507850_44_plen_57_part_00
MRNVDYHLSNSCVFNWLSVRGWHACSRTLKLQTNGVPIIKLYNFFLRFMFGFWQVG